jgi:hypothetical protein
MFKVDISLIAFLESSIGDTIVADVYNNPIQVDTKSLLAEARQVYTSVMSEWNREWLELRKTR